MGILSIVIKKVAEQASKAVLFGALVGGVSLASYATETTVGPTIEKAQLEAVHINLETVVEAISKGDPGWVESLPKLAGINVETHSKTGLAITYFRYTKDDDADPDFQDIDSWENLGDDPTLLECNESSGTICEVEFNGDEAAFETYLATATSTQMTNDGIVVSRKN